MEAENERMVHTECEDCGAFFWTRLINAHTRCKSCRGKWNASLKKFESEHK